MCALCSYGWVVRRLVKGERFERFIERLVKGERFRHLYLGMYIGRTFVDFDKLVSCSCQLLIIKRGEGRSPHASVCDLSLSGELLS